MKYLINSKKEETQWDLLTRDERYFCSHLYWFLKSNNLIGEFVQNIISKNIPTMDYKLGSEVQMGLEVCYYRDQIFQFEKSKGARIARKKSIMNYLKRTFDLCVFLPNDIIIIEAKVAQSLDTSQMNEFRLDKEAIPVLHEKLGLPAVNVHLMGLVSDSYSPSFDTKKNFDAGIITWKEIEEEFKLGYKRPSHLYELYLETSRMKSKPSSEEICIELVDGLVEIREEIFANESLPKNIL